MNGWRLAYHEFGEDIPRRLSCAWSKEPHSSTPAQYPSNSFHKVHGCDWTAWDTEYMLRMIVMSAGHRLRILYADPLPETVMEAIKGKRLHEVIDCPVFANVRILKAAYHHASGNVQDPRLNMTAPYLDLWTDFYIIHRGSLPVPELMYRERENKWRVR